MSRICGIAVATALLATIASTLRVHSHQLAYFNELVGGPVKLFPEPIQE